MEWATFGGIEMSELQTGGLRPPANILGTPGAPAHGLMVLVNRKGLVKRKVLQNKLALMPPTGGGRISESCRNRIHLDGTPIPKTLRLKDVPLSELRQSAEAPCMDAGP